MPFSRQTGPCGDVTAECISYTDLTSVLLYCVYFPYSVCWSTDNSGYNYNSSISIQLLSPFKDLGLVYFGFQLGFQFHIFSCTYFLPLLQVWLQDLQFMPSAKTSFCYLSYQNLIVCLQFYYNSQPEKLNFILHCCLNHKHFILYPLLSLFLKDVQEKKKLLIPQYHLYLHQVP